MRYTGRGKNSTSTVILAVIFICAALIYYFINSPDDIKPSTGDYGDAEVIMHFIDVGQGDAAFIDNGDTDILIDAGSAENVDDLVEYLDALGVEELDYIFFSHPHEDHIGGADEIIGQFKVKNVIMPKFYEETACYRKLIQGIDYEGCDLIYAAAGDCFDIGGIKIDILSPMPKYKSDDANGASLIMKVSYGEIDSLFTGDAEVEAEEYVLKNYADKLDCEILKVGHHGSSTSSCEDFIYAVSPEIALISVGKGNSYGHPHKETMKLLNSCVDNICRTDTDGDIVIGMTKDNYWIAK